MRDPARIEEVIKDLRKAWQNWPDMRLGQIVATAACVLTESQTDPFFMEDERLQEGLRKLARLRVM